SVFNGGCNQPRHMSAVTVIVRNVILVLSQGGEEIKTIPPTSVIPKLVSEVFMSRVGPRIHDSNNNLAGSTNSIDGIIEDVPSRLGLQESVMCLICKKRIVWGKAKASHALDA